jgi:N-acetylneuraminate synthase
MSIFIIAEIGINHNGDINIAKELIKVAHDAGCDAVKFQKRDIDLVYSKELLDSPRESPWGTTQRAQKQGLEFGQKEYEEIDRYCKELGIEWFASAWDVNSLKFLDQFDCKYSKIASAMIVDLPFVEEVAKRKKHTFISTAMSDIPMIEKTVGVFRRTGCPFELMYCVGTYPAKEEDIDLNCIKTLREHFKCNVGYSGHEVGLAISYGAAGQGISSLERHLTLDRAMYGSDQAASVEPAGFRMLVGSVRKIDKALQGDGIKRILPVEQVVADKLRAHIKTIHASQEKN